jgi:hypothetical protein
MLYINNKKNFINILKANRMNLTISIRKEKKPIYPLGRLGYYVISRLRDIQMKEICTDT